MNSHEKLFCQWQKAVMENDFLFSGGVVAEFSPSRGRHCQLQVHGNAIVLRDHDARGDASYSVIGGYSQEASTFWVHDKGYSHQQVCFADRDAFAYQLPDLFALGLAGDGHKSSGGYNTFNRMREYVSAHSPTDDSPHPDLRSTVIEWDNAEMQREHVEHGLPVLTSGVNMLAKHCRMELLREADGNLSLTEIQEGNFVWRLEECFLHFNETDESENYFRFDGETVLKEMLKHGTRWFENEGHVSFEYWENTLPPVVLELREDGTKPEGFIAPDGRVVSIGIGRMFPPDMSRFLTGGGPFGNPPEWADLVQAFAITNAFRSY